MSINIDMIKYACYPHLIIQTSGQKVGVGQWPCKLKDNLAFYNDNKIMQYIYASGTHELVSILVHKDDSQRSESSL